MSGNHYHRPGRDGDKGSYRDNSDYRGGSGGRDRYRDSDNYRRSRSKSRSRSRERKRSDTSERGYPSSSTSSNNANRDGGGYYEQPQQQATLSSYSARPAAEPSATIVIKGLPVHTTENTLYMVLGPYYAKDIRLIPQRENKGCFAFVEFISLDYAVYFMTAFAGSAGDPQAAQLIIDNRSTTIEYARPQSSSSAMTDSYHGHSHGSLARVVRSDWSCESCGCHNFAKRDQCFKCNLPRSSSSTSTTTYSHGSTMSDPFGDSTVSCETPSVFLVVKGFAALFMHTEDKIEEYFRQYAAVKSIHIFPDQSFTGGLAFVEFYSVEHAVYAKQCAAAGGEGLKVGFAREKVMHKLLLLHQQQAQAQVQAMQAQQMMPAMQAAGGSVAAAYSSQQYTAAMPQASQAVPWQQPSFATSTAVQPVFPMQPPQQLFWPPLFESNGGAYVFQPKSGYFHEPVTDFYYSPKVKLYYSGKDGVYYRWDGEGGVFVRFDPPLPSSTEPAPPQLTEALEQQAPALPSASITTSTTGKMSISLSASNKGSSSGGITLLGKKKATAVLKNIAKWGALQHEDDDDEGEDDKSKKAKKEEQVASAPPAAVTTAAEVSSSQAAPQAAPAIKASTSAANAASFVCLLCKRQFNSADMLSRHEKESKLHAENLAKQQKEQQQEKEQYHDRAKERRELFGSVADHVRREDEPKVITLAGTVAYAVPPPPPPPPFPYPGPPAAPSRAEAAPVHTDEHNPGNQIMRKLGWKEGQGLGRDNDGQEIAVGVELAQQSSSSSSTMQSTLRGTLGPAAGGVRSSNTYKESIQAAARARFEQLNNNK